MGDLQLLARILTAPFRFAYSLFQTVVMTGTVLVLLVVCPIVSLFTMPSYQHQANGIIRDFNKSHVLIDFSTNTVIGLPADGSAAYITKFPVDADYKSRNAGSLGHVPPRWGFWNLVGFYNDSEEWIEGKQAPMYAAYAEAASTSDALSTVLSSVRPSARIVLPDAPKIGMEYAYHPADYNLPETPLVVFGVCPVENCDAATNFHFREARELFAPSVTEGQAQAIAQMRNTMSDDYWLREAHANGIYDVDDEVRQAAALNRETLNAKFDFDPSNNRFWVLLEFGYLFLVLGAVVCFVIRIVRLIFY